VVRLGGRHWAPLAQKAFRGHRNSRTLVLLRRPPFVAPSPPGVIPVACHLGRDTFYQRVPRGRDSRALSSLTSRSSLSRARDSRNACRDSLSLALVTPFLALVALFLALVVLLLALVALLPAPIALFLALIALCLALVTEMVNCARSLTQLRECRQSGMVAPPDMTGKCLGAPVRPCDTATRGAGARRGAQAPGQPPCLPAMRTQATRPRRTAGTGAVRCSAPPRPAIIPAISSCLLF